MSDRHIAPNAARGRRAGLGVALGLGLCLAVPGVSAQTVELNPEHPQSYVVQQGDTLWDIAGRFLKEPWRWRDIWEANPQIKNPDLLYPGDEVMLTYREGEPVLQVRRNGRPTVKLSPEVREIVLTGAIPTIPIDAIKQFLSRPRLVDDGELEAAPYVASVGKEHLIAGRGDRVYVRGLDGETARQYIVYRKGQPYPDPADEKAILGFEAIHVADATLEKDGDPATLVLERSYREVLAGDRLVPVSEEEVDASFMPRAPDRAVNGRIVAVVDGVTQIGQYQIVAVNLGKQHGMAAGHVLAVYQTGAMVQDKHGKVEQEPPVEDPEAYVDAEIDSGTSRLDEVFSDIAKIFRTVGIAGQNFYKDTLRPDGKPPEIQLPDEHAGLVMVFRTFERVSYALVMKATRSIHTLDAVTNP